MYTYLKFGLPRVLPPNGGKDGERLSASRGHDLHEAGVRSHGERGHHQGHQNSSGYDSTDEELMLRQGARSAPFHGGGQLRAARSEDFLSASVSNQQRHRRSQRALNEVIADGRGGGGHHTNSIQKERRSAGNRDADFLWQRDRERKLKSVSEANLLDHHGGQFMDDQDLGGRVANGRMYRSSKVFRSNGHLQHAASSHDVLQSGAFVNRAMEDDEDDNDDDDDEEMDEEDHGGRRSQAGRMAKAASQISVVSRHSRNLQLNGGVSYRHEAPMLNDKYFPRDYLGSSNYLGNGGGLGNGISNGGGGGGANVEYDGFKYPHLQLRNLSFDTKAGKKSERILDSITMEARGGELVAILATKRKLVPTFTHSA